MFKRFYIALLVLAMMPALLQGATVIGDWSGTLSAGPQKLRLVLHVTKDEAGRLGATLDSLDQGALGLKFETVVVSDTSVSLGMPRLAAKYEGTLSDDGQFLRGTWTQGSNESPLSFERQKAEEIDIGAYKKLEGAWLGELNVGQQSLRVVIRVERDGDSYKALLDSPDQGGKDIPVSTLTLDGSKVDFEVGAVGGSYTGTLSEDGATITGTWSQGPSNLSLELKRTKEAPEARRPQYPKKPYPYKAVDVKFPGGADDVTLAGTLTIPKGEGPFPAVALITGSGAQDRDETVMGHKPFLVLSDYLTRHGIAVLRYDDRGTAKSTGSMAQATSVDFADDAEAAVRFLMSREETAAGSKGLIGHSEGALIAPMVANRGDLVSFVVLLAPPGVSGDVVSVSQTLKLLELRGVPEEKRREVSKPMRTLFAALAAGKPANELRELFDTLAPGVLVASGADPATLNLVFQKMTSPWMRYFLAYDPAPAIAELSIPALALWGERDLQVLVDINQPPVQNALAGGHPASSAEVLPGLNHLFQTCKTGDVQEYARIEETMSPVALARIADWVQKTTAPRQSGGL
jgi:uncharacterized protein